MKNVCGKFLLKLIVSLTAVIVMVSVLFGTTFAVNVACKDGVSTIFNKTLNVNRKKGKIVLDGKANEKAWKNATVIKNDDFTWGFDSDMIVGKSKPMDTAKENDIAEISSCKILWAPEGLYVYVNVKDTTPCVNTKEGESIDDVTAYYFDMTNKKATQYEGNNEAGYYFSRAGQVSGWGELNSKEFKSKSKSINKSEAGYTQEIFVACDWHGVKSLAEGSEVGFDIQVFDILEKPVSTELDLGYERTTRNIVWNSLNLAWTNPVTMGTLVLVDEPEKGPAFEKKNVTIKKGTKKVLKLNASGAKNVKFSVNKKNVKIIKKSTKSVTIKALKNGKVVIKAKAGGKVAKCKVTVK